MRQEKCFKTSIQRVFWALLDYIVEDVSRLENVANASVDQFESSHKQYKNCCARPSKRIESARRETNAQSNTK